MKTNIIEVSFIFFDLPYMIPDTNSGADPEGGAPGARLPPLKLEKIRFFFVKS
jgi:hypothetical protein